MDVARGKQSDLGNCQLRAIVQDFQPTYPSDYYHAHNHDSDFKARLARSRFKCELKVYEIHSHYCYVRINVKAMLMHHLSPGAQINYHDHEFPGQE